MMRAFCSAAMPQVGYSRKWLETYIKIEYFSKNTQIRNAKFLKYPVFYYVAFRTFINKASR